MCVILKNKIYFYEGNICTVIKYLQWKVAVKCPPSPYLVPFQFSVPQSQLLSTSLIFLWELNSVFIDNMLILPFLSVYLFTEIELMYSVICYRCTTS